jgi:iron complex outermembrane receptor protein
MNSLISFIFCALALIGVNAFAQSSSGTININTEDLTPDRPTTSTRKIEKVEVIGSHIKRVDIEGNSPVQTLDREYIESSGYSTAGDILREITANTFGSFREASGYTTAGASTVNLRGLGASNTLVLLDGKRMAKDGVLGAVDMSVIPAASIERIDVLKDGASAVYGSDALGGVINIITRKDFVGNEASIRQELTEFSGGERRVISLVHGNSTNRASYTTSFQYRKVEKVMSKSRGHFKEGISEAAPTANYYTAGGDYLPSPECTRFKANGACAYGYADESSALPDIQQFNNITNFSYDVASDMQLKGSLSASYKETNWNYAPGVVVSTVSGPVIDSYNLPGVNPGEAVTAVWRSQSLGTRDNEDIETSYAGNVSLNKEFLATWDVEGTIGAQRLKRRNQSINGYALADVMQRAIESGQINPFTNEITSIPEDLKYNPTEIMRSQNTYGEVKTSGELFDNWAGPVSVAFGGGYSYDKFSNEFDAQSLAGNVVGGGAGATGYGTRQSQHAFTELAFPLLSNWDLNISGRADRYSDFGNSFNPRIATSFQPIQALKLRASIGTGFKAPDLIDMYQVSSEGNPTVERLDGSVGQVNAITAGNPELKEETSKSYNIGMIVEPSKHFNMSFDFFRTDIDDQVGVSYQGIVDAVARGETAALEASGTTIDYNTNGSIRTINTRLSNVSTTKISGFDIEAQGRFHIRRIGSFVISDQYTRMLKYEQSNFITAPAKDLLGSEGTPRWRNQVSVSYVPTDRLVIRNSWLTTGKSDKKVESEGEIPHYTRWDTQISFQAWKGSTIAVGAINVLGEDPPWDRTDATNFIDSDLYDPVGRRFFASYKQRF